MRRRFRWTMLLRVLLLTATLFALAVSLLETRLLAVPLLLFLAVAVQILLLLRAVQAHVDALEEFFVAIDYQDFTRRFLDDQLDEELADAFNRVLERFQHARAERDLQASYLDLVVRHVPVPLLAARSDGSLSFVNTPARRLLGLSGLRNLRELAQVAPELPAALSEIPAGQRRLVQTRLWELPAELRVSVAELRREGEAERLYAIENLSGELSARERRAWRKLIRVLTHEIMNTLTPVTSLAETAANLLDEPGAKEDVREAMGTISRRSAGLMHFVGRYRELMQTPKPELAPVPLRALIDSVLRLQQPFLGDTAIEVSIDPPELAVDADRQLLEQVLINLIKNAREAMKATATPRLRLAARLQRGRIVLDVEDNGSGISEDIRDQVFIPFFTTRREGSGIGLSLSREIMSAHGGDILIENREVGLRVSLVFT